MFLFKINCHAVYSDTFSLGNKVCALSLKKIFFTVNKGVFFTELRNQNDTF